MYGKETRLGLVLLLAILIVFLGFGPTQRRLAAAAGAVSEDQPAQEEHQQPAQTGYNLSWWSVDGGGGVDNAVGGYVLGGTAGQADAGVFIANGYRLAGGFWPGEATDVAAERIYLPLVVRKTL